MSAYKLIEVVKTPEKETQAIYGKDDFAIAIADMKNDFGVAVKADDTIATYAVIIDQLTGELKDRKYWKDASKEPSEISIRDRVYTHNDYAEDNITAYDTEKLAIGNFNTKAAASAKKTECNFALTIRIDGEGNYKDLDVFNRTEAKG